MFFISLNFPGLEIIILNVLSLEPLDPVYYTTIKSFITAIIKNGIFYYSLICSDNYYTIYRLATRWFQMWNTFTKTFSNKSFPIRPKPCIKKLNVVSLISC